MTCNPSQLASQALALSVLNDAQLEGIKTYLMAKRYGLQNTDLRPYIGAYASLPAYVLAQLRVYLLGGTTGGGVINTSLPYYVIPASLITAAQILILCALTGTSTNPATLVALASTYTQPGYPRLAAQIYILNRNNLGLQDLLNGIGFLNALGEVCLTCGGQSILPFAEAGLWCASGSSLFDDLFEVWNFDNSLVGNKVGYTFNNANPGYVAGLIGTGLAADGVAGRNGSAAGTSIFNIGQSFTIAGWLKPTPANPNCSIAQATGATSLVLLGAITSMAGTFATFSLTHSGTNKGFQVAIGAGTFLCLFGGYDAASDKAFFRLGNAATLESTAFGSLPNSDIADFETCTQAGVSAAGLNAVEDIVAMWQRRLTSAEMDAFYNAGAGIQYPW